MDCNTVAREPLERTARRRAAAKMGWYLHAIAYVAVNAMLASISALDGRHWAVYPALGWGLGLAIHGAVVHFVTGGGLYRRLVQQERERLSLRGDPWQAAPRSPRIAGMHAPLSSEAMERMAQKRAGAKLGWYVHAIVYVVVNLFIFAISRHGFGDRPWSVFPLLGWGVGLTLHGVAVFLLGAGNGLRERLVEQERDRLRRERERS